MIKDRQIMKQKKLSCVQAKNVLSTNWLLNMLMLKPAIIFCGCFLLSAITVYVRAFFLSRANAGGSIAHYKGEFAQRLVDVLRYRA